LTGANRVTRIADIAPSAPAAVRRVEAKETTMQAQNRFAQLVLLPVAVALSGLAFQAAAAESQSVPAPAQAAVGSAVPGASTASADVNAPQTTAMPGGTVTAVQPSRDSGFGLALDASQLNEHRGGDIQVGKNTLTGAVSDDVAYKVVTGSNSINDGSFSNTNGLSTVIQNTGANVLIQNATVLNVHYGN
jgi:hypothetical protein